MRAAIDYYAFWSREHFSAEDGKNQIDNILYHYADENGLKGILDHQSI